MATVKGGEETLEELRAAGATDHQIDHWRKQGLVVWLRQEGRGRGEGSVSYYEAGTSRLISRLLELLAERRNQDHALLRLWLEGHPVTGFVHPILTHSATAIEAELESLEGQYAEAAESPDSAANLSLPRGLGWIRQHLRGDYLLLVSIVVAAFRGKPSELRDPDEVRAFRRLIDGAVRRFGWTEELTSFLKRDREGLESFIRDLSLTLPRVRESVEDLSADDLEEVRNDTVALGKLWGVLKDGFSEPGIVSLLYLHLITRPAGWSFYQFAKHDTHPAVRSLLTSAVKRMLVTGTVPPPRR